VELPAYGAPIAGVVVPAQGDHQAAEFAIELAPFNFRSAIVETRGVMVQFGAQVHHPMAAKRGQLNDPATRISWVEAPCHGPYMDKSLHDPSRPTLSQFESGAQVTQRHRAVLFQFEEHVGLGAGGIAVVDDDALRPAEKPGDFTHELDRVGGCFSHEVANGN
jgi:hypothetical protein